MEKKKILILVMSCQQESFVEQEKVCRETWAKDIIDGKYDNIEYYSYIGSCEEGCVSRDKHTIFCKADDGLWQTFQKTVECLSRLEECGVEYDYIFRTNTSTVVNVGLLDAFINSGIDENNVYCGEIYSIGVPCPGEHFFYARGNSIILSKKLIDIILDLSKYVVIPSAMFADDNIIGNIINTYHVLRFEPHKDFIKSYGFAWNKSLPKTRRNLVMRPLDNGVSSFYDDDESYNHLKNFISIQIKTYQDRSVENDKLRNISKLVCIDKDNYDDELKFIDNYMKNPKYYYSKMSENVTEYRNFY